MVDMIPPYRTYRSRKKKLVYEASLVHHGMNDFAMIYDKSEITIVRMSHHGELDIDLSETPDYLHPYFIAEMTTDVIDEFLGV